MNKKRLLIVGAGIGQYPAVLAAKKLGLETHVADINPTAYSIPYADKSHVVDIKSQEAMLNLANTIGVDAAFTMQSDHGVLSVAAINSKIGIESVPLHTALACTNKIESRQLLRVANSSQPNFVIVSSFEELSSVAKKWGYPFVVKSPDSSASRGVTVCRTMEDLKPAFVEARSNTSGTEILVEEYVDGIEFGAQTFSVNGKCEVVVMHSDIMHPLHKIVPIGHSMPLVGVEIDMESAIRDISNAVDAIGIINGPSNVDVKYCNKAKRLKVIEIGARIGATCLPELLEAHTGIDWVTKSIECLFTDDVQSFKSSMKQVNVSARVFYSDIGGKISAINSNSKILSQLDNYELNINVGDHVEAFRKGIHRCGSFIVSSDNSSISHLESLLQKAHESIELSFE